MSQSAPRELKILVERVVRPLPLTLLRQRRLRSELLTHLEGIYTEELARDSDPTLALARTAERFGDPAKISAELRETAGWSERWTAMQERSLAQRKNESVAGYSLRMMFLFVVSFMPFMFLVVLTKHDFHLNLISFLEYRLLAGMTVFSSVFLGGFLWLGLSWGTQWLRPYRGSLSLLPFSVGLASIWPVSLSLLMLVSGASWDQYHNPKLSILTLCLSGSLFTVFLGALVGVSHQRDRTYRQEWAELVID